MVSACGQQMVGWPADNVAPTVTGTTPADEATGTELDTTIRATFSEEMDPATLTGASFWLEGGGDRVDAMLSYSDVTAVLAPDARLLPDTLYSVTISDQVTDLAGNPLAEDYDWTFRTLSPNDDIAPFVTHTIPGTDRTEVGVNASVVASFSEDMDLSTLNLSNFTVRDGAVPIAGVVDQSGATAVFDPYFPFAPDTVYTATVTTGATDLAGNPLAQDYVWSFTTGEVEDLLPPTVLFTIPGLAEIDVSLGATVRAVFSEDMASPSIDGTSFEVIGPDLAPVTGAVLYDAGSDTAIFTPDDPFQAEATYLATITTGATDLAGNGLVADHVWTFTTREALDDGLPPRVVLTNPVDQATNVPVAVLVRASFSEAMDPGTITPANFGLAYSAGGGTVPGSVSWDLVAPIATFTPDDDLLPDTEYVATIATAVTDLDGTQMVQEYTWTFTTALALDLGAPTVIVTDPLDLEIDVPVDLFVEAAFSEAMDASSLSPSSFELTDDLGSPVTGAVSYDPLGLTATFEPDVELLEDTTYTATITTGATDLAGNPLASDYVWTFTTEEPFLGLMPVDLLSLESFVAVAGAGLTNSNASGTTTLNGDVGLSPTATCIGDGVPCTLLNPVINGTFYANDPAGVAAQAKTDLTAAYVDAASRPPGTVVNDLSGMVLAPGVYTSASTMSVAVGGTVTLDAQGDPNAVWIFQIGSALTVNNDAQVLLINGARAKNVFWAVFSSSTLGSNVSFQGSILAGSSNTVGTDSVVVGRLLCTTGQITLLSNSVTLPPL